MEVSQLPRNLEGRLKAGHGESIETVIPNARLKLGPCLRRGDGERALRHFLRPGRVGAGAGDGDGGAFHGEFGSGAKLSLVECRNRLF